MKQFMRQQGFTLIELLIVIALLGALAIGLIGAIDPFEQLKKGTDTGVRNSVSEIHSAIIRYYALKSWMPWCTDDTTCDAVSGAALNDGGAMETALGRIVDSGELKADFQTINSTHLGKIFVTTTTDQDAAVCYKPTAKSFQSDPNSKYTIAGVEDLTNCPATGVNACYWCVK